MEQTNPPQVFEDLERQLPESCVEYMLFVIDATLESRKLLSVLEAVRKAAMRLSEGLTKEYIWQKEAFDLVLKRESGMLNYELCGRSKPGYGYNIDGETIRRCTLGPHNFRIVRSLMLPIHLREVLRMVEDG